MVEREHVRARIHDEDRRGEEVEDGGGIGRAAAVRRGISGHGVRSRVRAAVSPWRASAVGFGGGFGGFGFGGACGLCGELIEGWRTWNVVCWLVITGFPVPSRMLARRKYVPRARPA